MGARGRIVWRSVRFIAICALAASALVLPARAQYSCKPWQNPVENSCVDKPGLNIQPLGYEPQEGETCWERSQLSCLCGSGQSMGVDSCGSCQFQGESKLDVVCLPYVE